MEKRLFFGVLSFRVVEEWWLCHGAKFASFYFLHVFYCWSLCFLIILVCFHLCCVFWCLACHFCFVCRCWSLFTPTQQPDYKLARCGFILLTDWESCHTHTTETLTHTHPSPFSPISIVSVHFSSFSALVLCLSFLWPYKASCSGSRVPRVGDDVLVYSLSSVSVWFLKPTGQFALQIYSFMMDAWDALFHTTKVDHFYNAKRQKKSILLKHTLN